jgi:hypothetical protein
VLVSGVYDLDGTKIELRIMYTSISQYFSDSLNFDEKVWLWAILCNDIPMMKVVVYRDEHRLRTAWKMKDPKLRPI